MWNFIDGAKGKMKEDNIEQAIEMMEGMRTKVDSIINLEFGTNIEELTGTHDLVLYAEFQDAEGLMSYQEHPEHVKIIEFLKEVAEDRACVDYEF